MSGGVPADVYRFTNADEPQLLEYRPTEVLRTTIYAYSHGQIAAREISAEEGAQPAISQAQAVKLAAYGHKAHRLYGPQAREMEWVKGQQLQIVQDRAYLPRDAK